MEKSGVWCLENNNDGWVLQIHINPNICACGFSCSKLNTIGIYFIQVAKIAIINSERFERKSLSLMFKRNSNS